MPNFTAGTSFTDGVTNDVTAAKLNALVADAVPTSSLSLNSTTGTIGLFSSGTGTAATPAIQPTGDTNTGIFFPAADTIAFSEGGAEAMRIDSSGNVGIGTASPSSPLHVSGSGATFVQINGGSAANQGSALKFQKNSTDTLILGVASAILGGGSTSNDSMIYTEGTNNTIFYNNATERLRIDSSGNVGIGGTPSTLLHLQATSPSLRIQAASGNSGALDFYRTASVNSGQIASESTNALVFSTNGVGNSGLAERLRIDSSGNVGIGTASPATKLTVSGTNGTNSELRVVSTGANTGGRVTLYENTSGCWEFATSGGANSALTVKDLFNNTERMRINSSGDVGIGTTSPDAKLAIEAPGGSTPTAPISCNATSGAGDRYAALFRYSGTLSGSVTVNGAAAAYNTSSDYRLKTNLEPISNGIERIKQLPVYRFNWKTNENGNKVDGFVAHEVTPIVREAIHGEKDAVDADGNPIYQGIDQSKIVPLLTAALKEAIAKIEVLESKVATLEAA